MPVVLAKTLTVPLGSRATADLGDRYNGAPAGVIPFVVQRSDRTSVLRNIRCSLKVAISCSSCSKAKAYPPQFTTRSLNEQQAYSNFVVLIALRFLNK